MIRDLRIQYALVFAVLGAVLPYASVYFLQAGLTKVQVGYVWAIWCGALVLSPVIVTMLADAHLDPRRLLAAGSLVTAGCLVSLGHVRGVTGMLLVWTGYCLTSMPLLPLMDGLHFSQQRRREAAGLPPRAYPYIRVWGTIGYMVPSLVLFWMLTPGQSLDIAMKTAAACAVVAAVQALLVDDPRAGMAAPAPAKTDRRLPTFDAARALLRPHLLVFVVALLLLQMAFTVHSGFYPIYLTERVKLDARWIGQASNLSVFVEMFFVFGAVALISRVGIKTLLLLAMGATALRLGLIASTNNVGIGVGTQVLHGIYLIATGVLPPMILNEAAEDRFRHSMQGLYVMIGGAGRTIANLFAGSIAAWSLPGLFWIAAGVSVLAGLIILFAFHEPTPSSRYAGERVGERGLGEDRLDPALSAPDASWASETDLP